MDQKEYIFADLVNIEELTALFEKFSQTTGFTTGLVDQLTKEILIGTGWRDICTKFHRPTPDSAAHCLASNKTLMSGLTKPGQIKINYCENGLVDGVTPIIINNRHLANLVTGQILFAPPDKERFRKQAEQYGYDSDAYLAALDKVPIVDEANFRTALEFLSSLATMIATTGMNRLEIKSTQDRLETEVADRKQVEKSLRESEEYLKAIHETMQVGLIMIDADTREIVDVNPAAAEIIKTPKEQIIGRECHNFICPKARGECPVLDNGQTIDKSERTLLDIDGREIPILKNVTKLTLGDREYLVETFVDIIERKQAEEIIETLIESLVGTTEQDCFDKIVSGLCKWLDTDCAIIGVKMNDTIQALSMQLDGKKIIGFEYPLKNSPCEVVTMEKTHVVLDNVCEKYPHDKELIELRARGYIGTYIVDKNNHVVGLINAISRQKLSPPPNVLKVMAIIATKAALEIERRQSRIEKEELELKLRQAYKMEAIGTLAGGIAHDFNNILSAIIGYGELTRIELSEDKSDLTIYVNEILEASKRAKDLVRQILTFSRQSGESFGPVQLYSIVKESLKLLQASIPTSIEIRKKLTAVDGIIMADPTQIHQVVMNLCTNAAHAMEESCGTLEIGLHRVQIGESAGRADTLPAGAYIELTVSDTGQGIAPDIQDKIFDPYFTTKRMDRGSGMGLAVVHGIVKSHGGMITVESEPGKGATFRVLFPCAKSQIGEKSRESREIPTGVEHILLVDDEKQVVCASTKTLQHIGYTVTACATSIEALETFKAQPEDFDLVITDQTMPNMTGVELAAEFLRIRPDIPIILCTGFSKQVDQESAKAAGISGFALKPIELQEIAVLIRDVLSGDADAE